jgi:hypothetical protein
VAVPLTLDIGQIGTYFVPFRHVILLLGIFKVDSGVHLGHLGATQPRKRGLKRATSSGSVPEEDSPGPGDTDDNDEDDERGQQ